MVMVAGIDPSLSGTAVAIGDGKMEPVVRVFSSERIDNSVRGRFMRYENMIAGIADFLEQSGVTVTYIEDYVFGNWNVTPMTEFGALLRWHLVEIGRVHEVINTTLKKFEIGRGRGSKKSPITKQTIVDALTNRYEVRYQTHDEYEAFALLRLGLIAEGLAEPMTDHECEAALLVAGRAAAKKKPAKRKRGTPKLAPKQGRLMDV